MNYLEINDQIQNNGNNMEKEKKNIRKAELSLTHSLV